MPGSIVSPTDDALDAAARALAEGKLVGMPTETVYGLAANAWDATAIGRIFEAKGRPANNPLIVHVASADRLEQAVAADLSAETTRLIERLSPFWPGPLTLVLPKHDRVPREATAGRSTVAVRVPDHPVALALLARCPFPLAAPSANRSNYVSPTTARHVAEGLGDAVSMILDGGACRHGLESTILTLAENPPRVLRHGALPAERLAEALVLPLSMLLREGPTAKDDGAGLAAPGQLPLHYSPATPLRFRESYAEPFDSARTGLIAFRAVPLPSDHAFARTELLGDAADEAAIARGLFAALRRLDEAGLDLILVDSCERAGLGRAIMDRLDRATRRDVSDER